MTYYIFLESAGQNLVNERYCNIPSISNASFGHKRSGSPLQNGLFISLLLPNIDIILDRAGNKNIFPPNTALSTFLWAWIEEFSHQPFPTRAKQNI